MKKNAKTEMFHKKNKIIQTSIGRQKTPATKKMAGVMKNPEGKTS